MSFGQAAQLHSDFEKLAQQNPNVAVQDAPKAIFNAILAAAKANHPDNVGLQAVPIADGRVCNCDMVGLWLLVKLSS